MAPFLRSVLFAAVACTVLVALPLQAQEFCPNGGEILTCPAWADMNGNRQYDEGTDELIIFTLVDSTLEIDSPWEDDLYCGPHPRVNLGSSDTIYDTAGFDEWALTIDGFDGSRHPNAFSLRKAGILRGTATLVDADGDNCYDGLSARRANGDLYALFGFEFLCTNGDGLAEYISANWVNASMFGMNGGCGMPGGDPQIWFPMVNSTLVPGPGFHSSGCLRQPEGAIPTLSQWGTLLTLLALAFAGWWLLRRRQVVA